MTQEGPIGAPAHPAYRLSAHDRQFLPRAATVVEGGVGAGILHRFKVTAGGRTRVDEPEPGA